MKKKVILFSVLIILIVAASSYFLHNNSTTYPNLTLTVLSSQDISAGSLSAGAEEFSKKYGCTVEFSNNAEECDLIYSSGEDFSNCQPIDKYINPKNRLYTREIIETACMQDGKIYGITNALLGNLNYGVYYPDQFSDITTPYEYFRKKEWTWENFINMAAALNSNISIDWTKSYINMKNSLIYQKDGSTLFDYGAQEQVEWLNFVRTLIFDKGIIDNSEGAFKIGFLPETLLNELNVGSEARYIPWPTKNGNMGEMFVDEYHFCVPKTAKNPALSVKLANYMIKSCRDTRLNLYRSSMTKEDFKILKKQLKKVYVYPAHSNYVPSRLFIDDFIHGKTVTEHIFNVENDADHIK